MKTLFSTSPDGTRVAYDVSGAGSATMLLHGGAHDRLQWHELGYVDRLAQNCTVLTVDIRGNGESDKPTLLEAYSTDRLCEDLIEVADDCGFEEFKIWGYSYGGNIGRYLAAQSDRVERIAILGIPFGPGASGAFRRSLEETIPRWEGILEVQRNDSLELSELDAKEIEHPESSRMQLDVARFGAILNWDAIEPADLRCPALWLVGSENESAMRSVREYEGLLKGTQVELSVLAGLDHQGEFNDIETVFPVLERFAG